MNGDNYYKFRERHHKFQILSYCSPPCRSTLSPQLFPLASKSAQLSAIRINSANLCESTLHLQNTIWTPRAVGKQKSSWNSGKAMETMAKKWPSNKTMLVFHVPMLSKLPLEPFTEPLTSLPTAHRCKKKTRNRDRNKQQSTTTLKITTSTTETTITWGEQATRKHLL